MSLTLSIAAVDRTDHFWLPDSSAEVDASLMAGETGSLKLRIYDRLGAAGYLPVIDSVLSLSAGATEVFAGVIDDADSEELTENGSGHITTITVSDWHAYCDRFWFTGSFNAGTSLRDVADAIRTGSGLSARGVTMDAGNMGSIFPNGPLMTTTVTFNGTVKDCYNKLRQLSGFIWRISFGLALIWREPAWVSCGYSLGDSDLTGVIGKVRMRKARAEGFANTVRLTAGPTGPGEPIAQAWAGDGVATVFALHGANVPASNAWPGIVNVDGSNLPLHLPGEAPGGNGIEWDWDLNDGTLSFLGTAAATATGATTITLTYTPMYPFVVEEEDAIDVAARGEWQFIPPPSAPEILKYAEAKATAQALIRTRVAAPTEVTVATTKGIAFPGQSVALAFASLGIAATYLITAVDMRVGMDAATLEYVLTCLSGTELGKSWLDFYKSSDTTSSGGGSTVVVAGGGGTTSTAVTSPIDLGGSRNRTTSPNPAAWTPVPDYWPYAANLSNSLRFRAFVSAQLAGVTVTVRLWDVTAGAAVPGSTSAPITPASPLAFTEFTATVAIVSGHVYRMEILSNTNGAGVLGLGKLEAL